MTESMAWSVAAVLLALGGAWPAFRGVRLVVRALREADDPSASLRLVRGIRGIVVAIGLEALAGGILSGQRWLLAFGLVFLAEELYETGVVALILRRATPSPPYTTPSRLRASRSSAP
jgi:hypothetical protein